MRNLLNEKGNYTVAFLVYFALFLFALVLILNLSKVWYAHSHSQTSADAASIAATQKVNEIIRQNSDLLTLIDIKIQEEVEKFLSEHPGMDPEEARREVVDGMVKDESQQDSLYFADYEEIPVPTLLQLAYDFNNTIIGQKVWFILSAHKEELAAYVQEYLKKNGSYENSDQIAHGRIEMPYTSKGRIRVIAQTELNPVWISGLPLPDFNRVEGEGVGPKLVYLEKMPPIIIEF
ncbi:MAG TPA: hypothetical protein DDY49_02860 [Paenibacillaceae bacterium]|nr:hypothetical protein [Paenibacillaceae bacterium]